MRIIKVEVDRDKVYVVNTIFCDDRGKVSSVAVFEDDKSHTFSAKEHELRIYFASAKW